MPNMQSVIYPVARRERKAMAAMHTALSLPLPYGRGSDRKPALSWSRHESEVAVRIGVGKTLSAVLSQMPKSSNMVFSGSTPKDSSVSVQALIIIGGPHM